MSSSSYNRTECFLCQGNPKSHAKTVKVNSRTSYIYSRWNESCAKSLCQLFNLDLSLFQNIFLEAAYCSPCHRVIRDIDFTLKSLSRLQQNLNHSRRTVETLLRKSYEKIQASENGIKQDAVDLLENGIKQEAVDPSDELDAFSPNSSKSSSYCSMIKAIFESRSSSSNNSNTCAKSRLDSSFDNLKFEGHSLSNNDDEDELDDYERLTRGSSRLKRSITIPRYNFGQDSDSEPDPGDCDSDFSSKVEVILGDVNNSGSEKKLGEGDDDSDDDWERLEARRQKKKYVKGSGGQNSRVRRTHVIKPKPSRNSKSKKPKSKLTPTNIACTIDTDCDFSTISDIRMKAHINQVHKGDPKPFHCQDCVGTSQQYKFGSFTRYYYHRRKVHQKLEPTIFCDVCKKSFLAQWELKRVRIPYVFVYFIIYLHG